MKTVVYVLIVIIGGLLFITPKPKVEKEHNVEALEFSYKCQEITAPLPVNDSSFMEKAEKNIKYLKHKLKDLDTISNN